MILERLVLRTACTLFGAWVGVLFHSLAMPVGNFWLAPVIGAVIAWYFAPKSSPSEKVNSAIGFAVALLLLGLFIFRTANLNWSEFQGDEARAVVVAERLNNGDTSVIFDHRKGPGEIFTAATMMNLFGSTNERLVRIPFAISGLAVLCAIGALAWRLSGKDLLIELSALAIASQDGVLLGFSRIVQYQMPMLLFALAAWILILSKTWRDNKRTYAWIGIFFGASMLCHYDAIFLVLPGIFLCVMQVRSSKAEKSGVTGLSYALAIAAAMIGAFYIPFVLAPHFSETAAYLSARAASVELPTNNLRRWCVTWQIYSGLGASISIFFAALFALSRRLGSVRALITILSLVCAVLIPKDSPWLALTLFVLSTGMLLHTKSPERFAWLIWIFPVFIFGFWFAKPNTHFLIATPALLLTLSYFLRESSLIRRVSFVSIVLVTVPFSLWHQYELFLQERTERPRLSSSVVEFGFPHRTGIKSAAEFLAANPGRLVLTNDDPLVAQWYLRDHHVLFDTTEAKPDTVLIAQHPREPASIKVDIERDYALAARVFVNEERALDIFKLKTDTNEAPIKIYDHP